MGTLKQLVISIVKYRENECIPAQGSVSFLYSYSSGFRVREQHHQVSVCVFLDPLRQSRRSPTDIAHSLSYSDRALVRLFSQVTPACTSLIIKQSQQTWQSRKWKKRLSAAELQGLMSKLMRQAGGECPRPSGM